MASKVMGGKIPTLCYIRSPAVLAVMMDAELAKSQYEAIKSFLKNEGYDILPPYANFGEEKRHCYPDEIEIPEKAESVSLQS